MELYEEVLAYLAQAAASDVIAALALLVATVSFLSSRRTSRRAVVLAQQAIDSRGRLAGARLRLGIEHWIVRVVNGTDPTVLQEVVMHIDDHEGSVRRPVHRYVRLAVDPTVLQGLDGPQPPIRIEPFQSVEWALPRIPMSWNVNRGCVHMRVEAKDALGRSVESAPILAWGFCDELRDRSPFPGSRGTHHLSGRNDDRLWDDSLHAISADLRGWLERVRGLPRPGPPAVDSAGSPSD